VFATVSLNNICIPLEFNLDGLRETLDAQASEIADKQDLSVNARKQLSEATQRT